MAARLLTLFLAAAAAAYLSPPYRPLVTTLEGTDCLFVNVYTRQLPGRENTLTGLPVMVYIHGGGFYVGSGDSDIYGPHYFMDEPVVLVTFNYRLGPFGFFTTHDEAAPGNYGLLDQVLLLQWVQDNIAAFGGDPKLVTIFGQSAGGASVSLLVLSPLGRGLFHRAISQSGVSFSLFAASGKRRGLADKLAAQLGCLQPYSDALVDCVKRTPAAVLLEAWKATGEHDTIGFIPRVDQERFLPLLPEDARVLLLRGSFTVVPWISGMTELEAATFLPFGLPDEEFVEAIAQKNLVAWSRFLQLTGESLFRILDCGANPIEETIRVLDFFIGDRRVTVGALARLLSDRLIVNEVTEEIRLASLHAPVYKYVLDHRGPGRLTLSRTMPAPANLPFPITELGVGHNEDILYLFTGDTREFQQPGTRAYFMVRFMVNLWANFARTGRPSSDVLPMPEWPIFTERTQLHMRLNSQPEIGAKLFGERVNFWKTVPINEQYRTLLDRRPCF
ncbi:pyrethroid hydrolase Ces2a-like [Amphibalanus amphitrite]|uniref:pyrethroid hydrolase Ces2a-like n=1 Tax=Amphibalanus amphitrite TaxID=1232801 RepID=UPI001C918303|nr:pyrethroid hydrolase Ces2a-like [Amphibalanus amphitrite]